MLSSTQLIYRETEDAPLELCKAVSDISTRIKTLEPRRKYLFLEWLSAHCSMIRTENNVKCLNTWLWFVLQHDVTYEHNLIIIEIDWWISQSDVTVERLMREHFVGRQS